MAPGWAGFLGLTGLLLVGMLALARLSQRALERAPPLPSRPSPTDGPQAGDEDKPDAGPTPTSEPNQAPARGGSGLAPAELSPTTLLANVALTHGLFAFVLVAGAWYFAIPASAFGIEAVAGSDFLQTLLLGLAFGSALWLGNEAGARIAEDIGVGYDETLRNRLAPDTLSGWVLLLGVVLPIIAIGEEVLFRGALVGVPLAGFDTSPWALAALSAVVFALGHGAQGRSGIVVTGLLGFVLAVGFVLSGSLLVVIVAHYVVNALEFLVHEGLGRDPFD